MIIMIILFETNYNKEKILEKHKTANNMSAIGSDLNSIYDDKLYILIGLVSYRVLKFLSIKCDI